MSQLLPTATSVGDICTAALKQCGMFGRGQNPLSDDINDAWAWLQWMLQEWFNKRYLVYHLRTVVVTSTGATYYTVGPGGNFDTGAGSTRPDKIEMGFLRQLVQSQPNQIDYPLKLLQAEEDYNTIALKGLVSFPKYIYYNPYWPLGQLYAWPIPQSGIYALGIAIKEQLPTSFPTLATTFNLPYEYYSAIVLNLAVRLRGKYQIPSFPGDTLPGLAKNARNVLRGSGTQIAQLRMPAPLVRPGIYNIFSDQDY